MTSQRPPHPLLRLSAILAVPLSLTAAPALAQGPTPYVGEIFRTPLPSAATTAVTRVATGNFTGQATPDVLLQSGTHTVLAKTPQFSTVMLDLSQSANDFAVLGGCGVSGRDAAMIMACSSTDATASTEPKKWYLNSSGAEVTSTVGLSSWNGVLGLEAVQSSGTITLGGRRGHQVLLATSTDGGASFSAWQTVSFGASTQTVHKFKILDYDGDGGLDVAAINDSQLIVKKLVSGSWSTIFSHSRTINSSEPMESLAVVKMGSSAASGIAWVAPISTSGSGQYLRFFYQRMNGDPQTGHKEVINTSVLSTASRVTAIDSADANADGFGDLLLSSSSAAATITWLNWGAGSSSGDYFDPMVAFGSSLGSDSTPSQQVAGCASADLDGDGDLELFTAAIGTYQKQTASGTQTVTGPEMRIVRNSLIKEELYRVRPDQVETIINYGDSTITGLNLTMLKPVGLDSLPSPSELELEIVVLSRETTDLWSPETHQIRASTRIPIPTVDEGDLPPGTPPDNPYDGVWSISGFNLDISPAPYSNILLVRTRIVRVVGGTITEAFPAGMTWVAFLYVDRIALQDAALPSTATAPGGCNYLIENPVTVNVDSMPTLIGLGGDSAEFISGEGCAVSRVVRRTGKPISTSGGVPTPRPHPGGGG